MISNYYLYLERANRAIETVFCDNIYGRVSGGTVCSDSFLCCLIYSSVSLIKSCTFQLNFWQNRSFTLLNLYSDQLGEPSEKCGDINFNIEYEYPTQTLKLKIIQVKEIKY